LTYLGLTSSCSGPTTYVPPAPQYNICIWGVDALTDSSGSETGIAPSLGYSYATGVFSEYYIEGCTLRTSCPRDDIASQFTSLPYSDTSHVCDPTAPLPSTETPPVTSLGISFPSSVEGPTSDTTRLS